jgi:hypothetical protein
MELKFHVSFYIYITISFILDTEGRAGMAAIAKNKKSTENDLEFVEKIAQHLCLCLMAPAIPLFIRLCDNVQKTGNSYQFIIKFRLYRHIQADKNRLTTFSH